MVVSQEIECLFARSGDVASLFDALIPACGRALDCQRVLLFVRHPATRWACCSHGWWDAPEHAFPRDAIWRPEPAGLADDDPMFALALRDSTALFIDDIEGAQPELLNLEYERREFGHRALIHAPIHWRGQCWGILEPCVFGAPRIWSNADRSLVEWLQERLGPLVAAYVAQHSPA